jgi:DNA-binding transcriptional LysR family regulator
MELKQIQYFETICKRKSFSKAAQELLVTQQCVSKNIQSLEQELGVQLFIRGSAGVTLTEEGHYFHEQAAIILQTQNDITAHFRNVGKLRNRVLQVGLSHGLSFFFDETFFQGFRQEYPDIELRILDLWDSQAEESVKNNTLDLGFTLAPVDYEGFQVEHLRKEPLYCIVNASHPLADRTSLDIGEILDEKIVMANKNYNSYYNFQKQCEKIGKHPDTIEMFDLMSIYEYVLHNNAVGFTLKAYSNILQFQNIRHIPLNDPEAVWDICVVYKEASKKTLIQKFLTYTRQHM